MSLLRDVGADVFSLGFFDGGFASVKGFLSIFCGHGPIVSSNMKANIICLLAFYRSGLVIVNGLGRYRRVYFFRWVVGKLVLLNSCKAVVIQNYGDYRFFRRFYRERVYWIPGSGGVKRNVGFEGFVTVSRKEKLDSISADLDKLISIIGGRLSLVGVNSCDLPTSFPLQSIYCVGYVEQNDILVWGAIYCQPDGYGEGVPHSLVDAIVSQMPVIIRRSQLRSLGLKRLGECQIVALRDDWVKVQFSEEASNALEVYQINKQYLSHLELG